MRAGVQFDNLEEVLIASKMRSKAFKFSECNYLQSGSECLKTHARCLTGEMRLEFEIKTGVRGTLHSPAFGLP